MCVCVCVCVCLVCVCVSLMSVRVAGCMLLAARTFSFLNLYLLFVCLLIEVCVSKKLKFARISEAVRPLRPKNHEEKGWVVCFAGSRVASWNFLRRGLEGKRTIASIVLNRTRCKPA